MSKDVLDRVSERALDVTEREVKGPGVFTDTGANMSRRKSIEGVDMDFVVNRGPKRGYELVKNVL